MFPMNSLSRKSSKDLVDSTHSLSRKSSIDTKKSSTDSLDLWHSHWDPERYSSSISSLHDDTFSFARLNKVIISKQSRALC